MKKMTTWSRTLASLLVVAAGCSENKTTPETTALTPAAPTADSTAAPAAAGVAYTCPLHPAVVSDHPGKCPKCGMDLIVKK